MSAPIERAAVAWMDHAYGEGQWGSMRSDLRAHARAAFGSIDTGELARVIEDADDALLAAGQVPATYLYPEAYQCIAATVKAWLVGEES